jgi:hypothetical protein
LSSSSLGTLINERAPDLVQRLGPDLDLIRRPAMRPLAHRSVVPDNPNPYLHHE